MAAQKKNCQGCKLFEDVVAERDELNERVRKLEDELAFAKRYVRELENQRIKLPCEAAAG